MREILLLCVHVPSVVMRSLRYTCDSNPRQANPVVVRDGNSESMSYACVRTSGGTEEPARRFRVASKFSFMTTTGLAASLTKVDREETTYHRRVIRMRTTTYSKGQAVNAPSTAAGTGFLDAKRCLFSDQPPIDCRLI